MVSPSDALPGRSEPLSISEHHAVFPDRRIVPPFPAGLRTAVFAMGCFWGAEQRFWQTTGVWSTAVGYAGGHTPNPTYQEVCTGQTGHAESVLAVFDPTVISYSALLKVFWENHDPTQGMRQAADVGTQYRSAIYTTSDEQLAQARASRDAFAPVVRQAGHGEITTEIRPLTGYFLAEGYHQQYLSDAKNPNGYCTHGPTGMTCPIGIAGSEG